MGVGASPGGHQEDQVPAPDSSVQQKKRPSEPALTATVSRRHPPAATPEAKDKGGHLPPKKGTLTTLPAEHGGSTPQGRRGHSREWGRTGNLPMHKQSRTKGQDEVTSKGSGHKEFKKWKDTLK